jgi:GlcNAc-P-P-Und epimerase
MHITVIGGSGFIGTRLCRILARQSDCDFLIYDKVPSVEFPNNCVIGDVRDLESLRKNIPRGTRIVNLAAEHRDDVRPASLYHEVNVGGAQNIAQVAHEKNIASIVFASSVAVYGSAPPKTGEDGALEPFNDYGRTKALAENVLREWWSHNTTYRSLIVIRPTVVFGEQNRGNVYNLLNQIQSGLFVMVGSGFNRKSMAYVGNVAAFFQYATVRLSGFRVFNYVDGPDFSMNDLVHSVSEQLGKPNTRSLRIPYIFGMMFGYAADLVSFFVGKRFPISAVRVRKFCMESTYSTSVAQLDFVAPSPLLEALSATIRYEFLEDHDRNRVFYSE